MLSDVVGERITAWRKARGWNRQGLAEACAKLGMPKLTAESLTNIESGRRKDGVRRRMVTIDEVVVIAIALRVPLDVLIIPYPDYTEIELAPSRRVSTIDAMAWLEGEAALSAHAFVTREEIEFWRKARAPRAMLRAHKDNLRDWYKQLKALASVPEGELEDLRARVSVTEDLMMSLESDLRAADAARRAAEPESRASAMSALSHGARERLEETRIAYAAARTAYESGWTTRQNAEREMRRIELRIVRIRETLSELGYPLPELTDETAHLANKRSSDYDGGEWRLRHDIEDFLDERTE